MTEGCFFLNRCTIPRYKVENRICQRYFWLVKQQLEHRSHWFTPQWECALTEKYAHEGAQSKQNDETIFPTLDGRHSPEINVDVQESINVIFRQRTRQGTASPPLLSEGTNESIQQDQWKWKESASKEPRRQRWEVEAAVVFEGCLIARIFTGVWPFFWWLFMVTRWKTYIAWPL